MKKISNRSIQISKAHVSHLNSKKQQFSLISEKNIKYYKASLSHISNVEDEDLMVECEELYAEYQTSHILRIRNQLKAWAISHKLTRKCIEEILKILRENHFEELPKDARTLLRQTGKKIKIEELSGGQFYYFGLNQALMQMRMHGIEVYDKIQITVNVDGVPITKSPAKSFWPILVKVDNLDLPPIVVAIYFGLSKPNNLDFLKDFVKEIRENNQISVSKFICDAPATALIKGVKGHSGYHSCGACICTGKYVNKNIVFEEVDCDARTDSNFRDRKYSSNHRHLGVNSPLLDIPRFDIVKGFPRDPLHLVDLGNFYLFMLRDRTIITEYFDHYIPTVDPHCKCPVKRSFPDYHL